MILANTAPMLLKVSLRYERLAHSICSSNDLQADESSDLSQAEKKVTVVKEATLST